MEFFKSLLHLSMKLLIIDPVIYFYKKFTQPNPYQFFYCVPQRLVYSEKFKAKDEINSVHFFNIFFSLIRGLIIPI